MTLQEFVLKNVSFTEYYKQEFEGWDGNHNTNVICPFHDEKKASFSVNINNKGGCFCQACALKIGSIIHFEKLRYELEDDETAASSIYSKYIRSVLSHDNLHPLQTSLNGSPGTRKKILEDIQITEQTIERFKLGWDSGLRRVSIPIFDNFNQLLNIRLYRLPSMREDESYPKLLNTEGYGSPAELFPKFQLLSLCRGKHCPNVVYWFSGERDTLLAWDRGIPSFCYTTGESVCKSEWAEELKALGVQIGIVQDNDKLNNHNKRPGEEGAKKRLALLQLHNIPCFLVILPGGEQVKDFSDYIREGNNTKEFLKLGHAKNGTKPAPPQEIPKEGEAYSIPKIEDPSKKKHGGEHPVAEIGRNPKLLDIPITVKAIISGKMDRTYSVPSLIEVGGQEYLIPISREMLLLVRENDDKIIGLIHRWLGSKAKVSIIKRMTVTEVEIIPMIQPGVDTLYVNQKCYYFGDYLECNKPYLMQLIPTTDMRSQETVAMITEIKPISNILDKYTFSEESCNMLWDEFNIGEEDSFKCLKSLAHSISINWSHIFNRDDLHICALLTWLSPLQFEFPCEGIQRGWLNALILGDTETGKSRVCQKLTNLFQSGVFINAESCSYVGLVGGAVKSSSGMFILRWGKIPLYNRQLVVVEELSGLTTEEISYMSEIRSAGIARYDKAGLTGETSAKTRLICLSNVRGLGKSLGDYNTGVQAAQGLVGQNEDLARFDLILTATDDEVKGEIINQDQSTKEKESFSSVELTAFRELAMFAWSLKPEQIDFTLLAYRACLQQTLKMSGEYHNSLPVFKSGSGRLKLARIALSIACIQFSWDSDRGKLVVLDKHVNAAATLLAHLFNKPSFGYARYSKIQYGLERVIDEDKVIERIQEVFKNKEDEFCRYISNALSFTKFDIAEALGVHAMFAERMISQMFLSNLLKKGDMRSEWILSRAGRKWFEKISAQYSKI